MALTNPNVVNYADFASYANSQIPTLTLTASDTYLINTLDRADNNAAWLLGYLGSVEYPYACYNLAMAYLIIFAPVSNPVLTQVQSQFYINKTGILSSSGNGATSTGYVIPTYATNNGAFSSLLSKVDPWGVDYLSTSSAILFSII